jgi:hypothetical protein
LIERSEGRLKPLAIHESQDKTASVPPTVALDQTIGNTQFRVTVQVDSKDLAGWSADQIAAFFQGLSTLVSAKVEK